MYVWETAYFNPYLLFLTYFGREITPCKSNHVQKQYVNSETKVHISQEQELREIRLAILLTTERTNS